MPINFPIFESLPSEAAEHYPTLSGRSDRMTSLTDPPPPPREEADDNDNTVYIYNAAPDVTSGDRKKKSKEKDRLPKKSPVEKKMKNPLKVLKKLTIGG